MGRSQLKSKASKPSAADTSAVARNLSDTLEIVAKLPAKTVQTPAPSKMKTSATQSKLSSECHLLDHSVCKTPDDMAIVCANIISTNLNMETEAMV